MRASINNNIEINEIKNVVQYYSQRSKLDEEYMTIVSIIPEHKFINLREEDVLFQSNVKRLLNQEIGNHISQTFTNRFCMTTKNYVKLFKSREQFLKVSKPTNVFQMSRIKSVKRFYLKSNKKIYFFVLELSDLNNKTGMSC
jgi:hypothetical protein